MKSMQGKPYVDVVCCPNGFMTRYVLWFQVANHLSLKMNEINFYEPFVREPAIRPGRPLRDGHCGRRQQTQEVERVGCLTLISQTCVFSGCGSAVSNVRIFIHLPGRASGSEIYLPKVIFYLPLNKLFYFSSYQIKTVWCNISFASMRHIFFNKMMLCVCTMEIRQFHRWQS